MPAPILDQEQIARLNDERAKQVSFIATMSSSIGNKTKRIEELGVADASFKKFFDYYNNIITKYEEERKAIDGKYIANPITEADVLGPASINGSVRTTPSMPQTDIVRVSEFDGGPLVQEEYFFEQQHIINQAYVENSLVNGFPFTGSISSTTVTTTALTSASTILGVTDSSAYTINPGDIFAVTDGMTVAVVKALSITNTTPPPPEPPPATPGPSTANINIEMVINPIGTIASGSNLQVFSGFNNTERINKDANLNELQGIMDALIVMLTEELGNRDDRLQEQLAALNANEDDNSANNDTAKTNAQSTVDFIENYLVNVDISDAGLLSLSNERSLRTTYLSTRISQIEADKAEYYDKRYGMANDRGNTSRGTLRLQKSSEGSLGETNKLIQTAQDQIASIDQLLGS